MTTKRCETCKGTGHREVAPWEEFADELAKAGILTRWEGYVHEGRPEESDARLVMYHRGGADLAIVFGDIFDDKPAQVERIARFRAELDKLGGVDALVRP